MKKKTNVHIKSQEHLSLLLHSRVSSSSPTWGPTSTTPQRKQIRSSWDVAGTKRGRTHVSGSHATRSRSLSTPSVTHLSLSPTRIAHSAPRPSYFSCLLASLPNSFRNAKLHDGRAKGKQRFMGQGWRMEKWRQRDKETGREGGREKTKTVVYGSQWKSCQGPNQSPSFSSQLVCALIFYSAGVVPLIQLLNRTESCSSQFLLWLHLFWPC